MAAICLALLLGGVGGHKFYLGERAHGIAYLALCWTLLPWIVAVFEAINYAHMSRVTFNLIYNIESILLRMPADAEEENLPGHEDVFSMEVSESSDDIVDQFTKGR